jgi:hypothetical protein
VGGAGLVRGDVEQLVQGASVDDVTDQFVEGGRLRVEPVGAVGPMTVALVGAGDEGDALAGVACGPGDRGAGRDMGGGILGASSPRLSSSSEATWLAGPPYH